MIGQFVANNWLICGHKLAILKNNWLICGHKLANRNGIKTTLRF